MAISQDSLEKTLMLGGQEEKGTTEGEMDGQCHRSYQHESDPTLGGRRQEGLACSGLWGHEESDTTKQLNNINNLVKACCYPLERN